MSSGFHVVVTQPDRGLILIGDIFLSLWGHPDCASGLRVRERDLRPVHTVCVGANVYG